MCGLKGQKADAATVIGGEIGVRARPAPRQQSGTKKTIQEPSRFQKVN